MSDGVTIWRCTRCSEKVFPQRLLCPKCHGHSFAEERVREGVVEEVVIVRHMIGQENWQPRRIANVRTAGGPHITVGLRDESGPGTAIELWQEEAAHFGHAKGAG